MFGDDFLLPVLGGLQRIDPYEVFTFVLAFQHGFDVSALVLAEVKHEVVFFATRHVLDVATALYAVSRAVDTSLSNDSIAGYGSTTLADEFHNMLQFGIGNESIPQG